MRRIKTLSVSAPCVGPPYTTFGANLKMIENAVRTNTDTTGGYVYKGPGDTLFVHDLVGIQSFATSSGQRDAGLFELSFGDERYLPFEGAGAVSRWRLELPEEYRQFDYNTISDVILHMLYTARDGGNSFKMEVRGEIRTSLNKIADILATAETGLTRIISAAHEFSTEWHRFMHPVATATSHDVMLKLDKQLFPFMLKERQLDIHEITIVLMLDDPSIYSSGSDLQVTFTHPDGTKTTNVLSPLPLLEIQPGLAVATSFSLTEDVKEIKMEIDEASLSSIASDLVEVKDGKNRLDASQVKDMLLVVNYTIGELYDRELVAIL